MWQGAHAVEPVKAGAMLEADEADGEGGASGDGEGVRPLLAAQATRVARSTKTALLGCHPALIRRCYLLGAWAQRLRPMRSKRLP